MTVPYKCMNEPLIIYLPVGPTMIISLRYDELLRWGGEHLKLANS